MPSTAERQTIEVLLFLLPPPESPEGPMSAWCLYRHEETWWVRYGPWSCGTQSTGRLVNCSKPGGALDPEAVDQIKAARLERGYQLGGLYWLDPASGEVSWSRDYWSDPATGKIVHNSPTVKPTVFPDTPRAVDTDPARPQLQGRRWPRVLRLPG